MTMPPFRTHELPVVFELIQALQTAPGGSLALQSAWSYIKRLVPSAYGAMCSTRADNPAVLEWTVAEMGMEFFHDYARIAPFDFVRSAVERNPNVVLSDTEIVPIAERREIERHPLTQYARSHLMTVAQIMSVRLGTDPSWTGGLTLYRDKPIPYSAHERQVLQFLMPYVVNTMNWHRRYGDMFERTDHFGAIMKSQRTAIIRLSWDLQRWDGLTNGIESVLGRCFGKTDRADCGLPKALRAKINELPRGVLPAAPMDPWIPKRPGAGVVVYFEPHVRESGSNWFVYLDEAPFEWRVKLTAAELDVAVRAAMGWGNEVIALDRVRLSQKTSKDRACSPHTIRTQLNKIYEKLGIERREMLAVHFRSRG